MVPKIDNPIVSTSTKEITTAKTDFLYSDFLKRRNNFHIDVNNKLINKTRLVVQPNEEIEIMFNQKPSNYSLVRMLDNGNYENVIENFNNTNDTLTAPSNPGKYVFSISAS